MAARKGTIGILTGGGDVPGLNPAIRAVTLRAIHEGYRVIGIRRGWGGLVDIIRDKAADNSGNFIELTEDVVMQAGRTGAGECARRPRQRSGSRSSGAHRRRIGEG